MVIALHGAPAKPMRRAGPWEDDQLRELPITDVHVGRLQFGE